MNRLNQAFLISFSGLLVAGLLSCSYHEDKHPLTSGVGQSDPNVPAVQKTTYTYIDKNILSKACTECHAPGGEADDAPLDTYNHVMDYVKKGDPNGSLLIKKMNKGMPPAPRQKLPADVIQIVSDWIQKGADNN